MKISVREALQLEALRGAEVVAGAAGLDREIGSVNIMEVPNIRPYVKKDEFLVTTTYPIKDDPEAQAALIKDLAALGLAGLAIKPVWYNMEVPAVMIQQAEELAFPLIKLPRDASFNEIINPILAEILNRQARVLKRNEEVHNSLTTVILNGGSLDDVALMVASWLQLPVTIHSAGMRLLADSGGWVHTVGADTERLKTWIGGERGAVRIHVDGRELTLIVHPATVAGENYAYLILWQEQGAMGKYQPDVVERACQVVALEIAKRRAVAEVEQRYRASFIHDLIQGRVESRADALYRGEICGWDLSGGFVPALLQIDGFHSLLSTARGHAGMARLMHPLWDAASRGVSRLATGSIAVDMGSRILILVQVQEDCPRQQILATVQDLLTRVTSVLAVDPKVSLSISAGIGRRIADIMDLKTGFVQAQTALEIGRQVRGAGSVTHFDDLGVYRILANYTDRRELEQYCNDVLGVLLEKDQHPRADLLRTLEAVLAASGNLKEAARSLFVHYNTLRYRIARIEEMIGVNLGSSEDRLRLQIALKILRMQEKT